MCTHQNRLISSNYPCLEHIFMVPKVFKPVKFYSIYSIGVSGLSASYCMKKCLCQTGVICRLVCTFLFCSFKAVKVVKLWRVSMTGQTH